MKSKGLNEKWNTLEQIIEDLSVRGPNTVSGARARLAIRQSWQPANSGVVHSFCNVEAKVESAVIAATQDKHELSSFMFSFDDLQFRVFFLQLVRIEECSFVPHVLAALTEMLREV